MRVSIFSITLVSKISHCKKNLARNYHKYTCLHVKYPLFLSDFNESWIVLTCFLKNTQTSNFMKIHPAVFCPLFDCLFNYETCSFHALYETKQCKPEAHLHIIFHILVIHFFFSVEQFVIKDNFTFVLTTFSGLDHSFNKVSSQFNQSCFRRALL